METLEIIFNNLPSLDKSIHDSQFSYKDFNYEIHYRLDNRTGKMVNVLFYPDYV
jgi:hypothetical protein